MNKPTNKKQYAFLFLIFLFVLQIFLYENDICSPCDAVSFKDITHNELVYKPEAPLIQQTGSYSFNNDNELPSYALQHIINDKLKILCFRGNQYNEVIHDKHIDLPSTHILTVLKKKNNCHQSADEPFPHINS